MKGCGRCHTCGSEMKSVLDGEEWCEECQQYRRYASHGWGHLADKSICGSWAKPSIDAVIDYAESKCETCGTRFPSEQDKTIDWLWEQLESVLKISKKNHPNDIDYADRVIIDRIDHLIRLHHQNSG